jgi:hypothetical protein
MILSWSRNASRSLFAKLFDMTEFGKPKPLPAPAYKQHVYCFAFKERERSDARFSHPWICIHEQAIKPPPTFPFL